MVNMTENAFTKARRCGFSNAMRAKLEADIKAGKKVFVGMDYAKGKDFTAELNLTPYQRESILFFKTRLSKGDIYDGKI